MCEELKKELEKGTEAASELVAHMERMGASSVSIPISLEGMNYVVIIQPLTDDNHA